MAAADDIKAIGAEAQRKEYGPKDIAAMKKMARLRLKDKIADEKERLAAEERVARAIGMDLFGWADTARH